MRKVVFVLVVLALAGGGVWYMFLASPKEQAVARARLRQVGREAESAAYDAKYQVSKVIPDSGKGINSPEAARKCRENLKRIESAKRQAAAQSSVVTGEVALDSILRVMGVSELPRCPSGGEYLIGPMNTTVRCTIGANGTPTDQDDHSIQGY